MKVKIFKELTDKTIRFSRILTNAISRTGYFSQIWECAEIILFHRSISFFRIILKVIEKLMHKRLIVNRNSYTVRIYEESRCDRTYVEEDKYYIAIFLDVE